MSHRKRIAAPASPAPPRRRARVLLWPHPVKAGWVRIDLSDDDEGNVTGKLGESAAARARETLRYHYGAAAERVLGTLTGSVECLGDFHVPRDRRLDQVVFGSDPSFLRASMASTASATAAAPTQLELTAETDVGDTLPSLECTAEVGSWAGRLRSPPGVPRCPTEEFGDTLPATPVQNDPYCLSQPDVAGEPVHT
jgi:hypothetical protein